MDTQLNGVESQEQAPYVKLRGGDVSIPQLGFGLFQVEAGLTERVVEDALDVGYRHFDTASAYENEAELGKVLQRSSLARNEYFVTTKLWNEDHGRGKTLDAFQRSLDALGLDHVDLYLIHWPAPARGLFVETWAALEEIAASGQARAIGVSNFLPEHIQELESAGLSVPAVNQIEVHIAFQQREIRKFMSDREIKIQSWAPLGHAAYELTDLPGISDIAEKHQKSVQQIVIRWHIQEGLILMPKSLRRERMQQNIDVFDFLLTDAEMHALRALDAGRRIGSDPMVKL